MIALLIYRLRSKETSRFVPGGKVDSISFIFFLIPLATSIVLASDCWYIPIPTTCFPSPLKSVLVDAAPTSTLATSSRAIIDPSLALLRGNFL